MAGKKAKKPKAKKVSSVAPMPSLIYSEGVIGKESPTPKADIIEQALLEKKEQSEPVFEHLSSYNPSARRLMWVAVVSLTFVVCAMWSWSIYSQLTSINWNKISERNLIDDTKNNWNSSFRDEQGRRLTTDQQVKTIKSNLEKLFAEAAASSSPVSSTPEVSTTTP